MVGRLARQVPELERRVLVWAPASDRGSDRGSEQEWVRELDLGRRTRYRNILCQSSRTDRH